MLNRKSTSNLPAQFILTRRATLTTLLLCLAASSSAQSFDAPDAPDARAARVDDHPATEAARTSAVLPAAGLGADDLLEIMVSYCPQLSHNFRVSSDGTLSLPMLHENFKVAGLTPIQVSEQLRTALIKEGILADPTVNVSVVEYRSRPVSVVGAVLHPVTFQATGRTTLLDALANAGGLGPTAGSILILTSKPASPAAGDVSDIRMIRVKDLLSGADPQFNPILRGGEEVRVPEASKIFVAGDVRRPGMYPMLSESETTVLKAITMSEGLDQYSAPSAFIYRKRPASEERDELKIPLKGILSHKDPDVALKADDILYIPGSDGKRVVSRILNELAGFGQTAGSGLLIYK